MWASQRNGGIPHNHLLVGVSANTASCLKVIALKPMLFFSLYTRAETLIFTFVPKSFWFTDEGVVLNM